MSIGRKLRPSSPAIVWPVAKPRNGLSYLTVVPARVPPVGEDGSSRRALDQCPGGGTVKPYGVRANEL